MSRHVVYVTLCYLVSCPVILRRFNSAKILQFSSARFLSILLDIHWTFGLHRKTFALIYPSITLHNLPLSFPTFLYPFHPFTSLSITLPFTLPYLFLIL